MVLGRYDVYTYCILVELVNYVFIFYPGTLYREDLYSQVDPVFGNPFAFETVPLLC